MAPTTTKTNGQQKNNRVDKNILPVDYSFLIDYMKKIESLSKELSKRRLGYPSASSNFGYDTLLPSESKHAKLVREQLHKIQDLFLNNLGSPYNNNSHGALCTGEIERLIITKFAQHFNIKAQPTGHITSGGTESNLTALWWSKNYLMQKARSKSSGNSPVVMYSQQAHHSIKKLISIMSLPSLELKTNASGEVEYEDLCSALSNLETNIPIIFIANIGSTEYLAIDDVAQIHQILLEHYGNDQSMFTIHLDAALLGPLIPLLNKCCGNKIFQYPGVRSIAFSGHKFLSCTSPCGVFMAINGLKFYNGQSVHYLGGIVDETVACSRSGHLPLMLFLRMLELGIGDLESQRLKNSYDACVENALWLSNSITTNLNAKFIKYYPPSLQLIVWVPTQELVDKYQLMPVDNSENWAALCILPHATRKKLARFLKEYILIGMKYL